MPLEYEEDTWGEEHDLDASFLKIHRSTAPGIFRALEHLFLLLQDASIPLIGSFYRRAIAVPPCAPAAAVNSDSCQHTEPRERVGRVPTCFYIRRCDRKSNGELLRS